MNLPLRRLRYMLRAFVAVLAITFMGHIYMATTYTPLPGDSAGWAWLDGSWRVAIEQLPGFSSRIAHRLSETTIEQDSFILNHGPERMNASFVTLARNSELEGLLRSIQSVDNRFNRNWHYDWIFLNDDDFTEEFKAATTAATSGRARYGKVSKEHWSFPDFIDQQRAEAAREEMKELPYGNSISYRHMCRWQSGFFYLHPLVLEYEWYWRIEPSIEFLCDIPYDPFRFMAENRKRYSFVIAPNELKFTIPSLWDHVKGFMRAYPQHINSDNHLFFLSEDGGLTPNYCQFWSNFEIASLDWFRSDAYNDFFKYLDNAGGFFYERWGDASIHSIAAALMLKKGEIHFFHDIGYHHSPYLNCPRSSRIRSERNCNCNAEANMDWNPSCAKRFFEVAKLPFPEGYNRNVSREAGILG